MEKNLENLPRNLLPDYIRWHSNVLNGVKGLLEAGDISATSTADEIIEKLSLKIEAAESLFDK